MYNKKIEICFSVTAIDLNPNFSKTLTAKDDITVLKMRKVTPVIAACVRLDTSVHKNLNRKKAWKSV